MEQIYKHLGSSISSRMPVEQQIIAAGLDWKVLVEAPRYGEKIGQELKAESFPIAYRSDTGEALTCITDSWVPYQNDEFLRDFNNFCNRAGLQMERAGYLKKNSVKTGIYNMVFATALVPETLGGRFVLDDRANDVLEARVVFYNHHQYGYGAGAHLYHTRLVCTNGMTLRIKNSTKLARHITSHLKDGQKISDILNSLKQNVSEFNSDMLALANTGITQSEAQDFLIDTFGDRSKPWEKQPMVVRASAEIFAGNMDDIVSDVKGVTLGSSSSAAYNTAYGLLQSVTAFETHLRGNSQSTQAQMINLWAGEAAKESQKAYNSLALAYIRKQPQQQVVSVGVRG